MRFFAGVLVLAATIAAGQVAFAQRKPYRTLNDTFAPPQFTSLDEWNRRAAHIRELILASAGLLPMPERSPLRANVFDEIKHPDHLVSKVYFESLPGFFVTGNLYRPIGDGPFPAILSPHGHWAYGRLENSAIASVPGRAINLARQGFVVFTYDMARLQRQPAARTSVVRRAAREVVGAERGGASVVERHQKPRLSRVVAVRASAMRLAPPAHRAAARRCFCSRRSTNVSRWRRRST